MEIIRLMPKLFLKKMCEHTLNHETKLMEDNHNAQQVSKTRNKVYFKVLGLLRFLVYGEFVKYFLFDKFYFYSKFIN